MSTETKLIPAKIAAIVWKPRKYQNQFELKVYCKKIDGTLSHYDDMIKWPCSSGCVNKYWPDMTPSQMFAECIKILFQEGVTNKTKIKECLFEFGKIRELEEMRMMYHALYYQDQIPYEGLLPSFYGWDFCDGR